MYFGLLDSIEWSFYLKLIEIENWPLKPQIFIKIHVLGLDSTHIPMRFNFNQKLEWKTNPRVSNLHLNLAWKTGLDPKCHFLPVCYFSQFCRVLVLQNLLRRASFAWARHEFVMSPGRAWASFKFAYESVGESLDANNCVFVVWLIFTSFSWSVRVPSNPCNCVAFSANVKDLSDGGDSVTNVVWNAKSWEEICIEL